MSTRIVGIDVARALAVIGMIIVNFKVVFGDEGSGWATSFAVFEGKPAATFVVLAGVGIALISNSAIRNNDLLKLNLVRRKIVKRALFLIIFGLAYMVIWPADILHYNGVFMLITMLFLTCKARTILIGVMALIVTFPILMTVWYYETGWNIETFDYEGFWTLRGFFRNLFYNGFYPIFPWAAFMLVGFWFGKQDLLNNAFVKKTLIVSALCFVCLKIFSYFCIYFLSERFPESSEYWFDIFGTNPIPPLPVYMFTGISTALVVISACVLFAKKFENTAVVEALRNTGELALTFYVVHVIAGMGLVEALNPSKMGEYSADFSVIYAVVFSALCIAFAIVWRKYNEYGPLEWVMRKATD